MKRIVMLLVVAILLAGGLILASCKELRCPGSAAVDPGDCYYSIVGNTVYGKACSDYSSRNGVFYGCMSSGINARRSSGSCDC